MTGQRLLAQRGLPTDLLNLLASRTIAPPRAAVALARAVRPQWNQLAVHLHSATTAPLNSTATQEPKESTHRDGNSHTDTIDRTPEILAAALASVPELGWTSAALTHGCVSSGLPSVSAGALFPRGPIELVEHFMDRSLDELKNELAALDMSKWERCRRVGK